MVEERMHVALVGGTSIIGQVYLVDSNGNTIDPSSNFIEGEPFEWRGTVDDTTEADITFYDYFGRRAVIGFVMNNSPLIKLHLFVSSNGTTYNNFADFATAVAADGYITVDEGGLGYALDKHPVHTIKLLAASGTVDYRVVMI